MNQKLTRMLGNVKLKINEKAPNILFVSGIVLGITTVVLACKETLSVGDILDSHVQKIDDIKNNEESDETTEDSENVVVYNRPEDKSRLILRTYANTLGRLAKLYYPSVLCGTASILLLTKSHSMQNERYLASISAYMALKQEYDKYRESVSNDIGKEKANDYKAKAVNNQTFTDGVANPPYGKNLSGYAKIFDEYNPNWNKDASLNNVFLRRSLNYLNNKLQAQGYLFLNDVYRELGFEPTKAGQIVGWSLNNPNGDGYIDFGLDRNINKQKAEFINGLERSVILDFNPDGPILDLLLWEK